MVIHPLALAGIAFLVVPLYCYKHIHSKSRKGHVPWPCNLAKASKKCTDGATNSATAAYINLQGQFWPQGMPS